MPGFTVGVDVNSVNTNQHLQRLQHMQHLQHLQHMQHLLKTGHFVHFKKNLTINRIFT